MKFADLNIGVRLGIGFSVILVLMAIMATVGLTRISAVGATAQKMAEEDLVKERLARQWLANVKENGVRTLALLKVSDPATIDRWRKNIAITNNANDDLIKQLGPMLQTPEGKQKFDLALEKRKQFGDIRDSILDMKDKNVDQATLDQEVDRLFMPARQAYYDSMDDIVDFQREILNSANADIQSVKYSSSLILAILAVVSILVGAMSAWHLALGITRPLGRAVEVAETVAAGDLTTSVAVDSKDEIGQLLQALKKMNDNLAGIVGEVRTGTETIATASSQIASGNLDLSSRTEEQASSLEETASAMEELTSTVKQNADNAQQANQLAASASGVAVQGGQVVEQVISTMQSISDSSKRIADIIGVIDGIAFQTNILALNAAVEAARAGEQGRGFAVVASEVRNLAQRSANAAKEIKSLITDSVESVEVGSKLVEQAGATMREVVNSVQRVTDIVSEISAASHEQSTGIEQVNQAIGQMDEVTQQNAALVEEAAAASQSLQDQAASLAQAVSVFKVSHVQARAVAPRAVSKPQSVVKSKVSRQAPAAKTVAPVMPTSAGSADEWAEF
ncbi:methyl-accepting chemotaxis protein [Methylobacillus methanolivorans]|uniref:Methyl-accepting chemotaxis protein n=1 Tax=Methylobacillus methanolivorans TaxID=1848927 RepID=A0ABW8GPF0_9PROT